MHIPPFLRILLHHLPDSGYARCQYIYFLFGLLTMIFHSVRRVGFHLYMAVSTLQLTSIRNLSEYWQLLLKHTSRCRSIFGFHILLSDTAVESCVTFKPRKAPIQLIQFSRFNNQTTYRQEHEPASYHCRDSKRKCLLLHCIFHQEISEEETDAGQMD